MIKKVNHRDDFVEEGIPAKNIVEGETFYGRLGRGGTQTLYIKIYKGVVSLEDGESYADDMSIYNFKKVDIEITVCR